MVRPKRSTPRRRPRRSSRRRKKQNASASRSANPANGILKYPVTRSFSLFPRQWNQTQSENWLSKLDRYGAIAMKALTLLLKADTLSSTWAMYGTVQSIALGAEDLVWSSPIREMGTVSLSYHHGIGLVEVSAPRLDYRQGKLHELTVRVNCGSIASKKAGRYCLAIVPLTEEEAKAYHKSVGKTIPTPKFEELLLMPGAVTAQYGTPLIRRWSPGPSDFGRLLQRLGQTDAPTKKDATDLIGGLPICLVVVGYQDFASSKSNPDTLYAPEEALVNVDITAKVTLREFGGTWIRPVPIHGDGDVASVTIGCNSFSIPADHFSLEDGVLTTPMEVLPENIRNLALLQSSCTEPLRLLPLAIDNEEEIEDGECFEMLPSSSYASP